MARLATCGFERPVTDTTWRSPEGCTVNANAAGLSFGTTNARTGSCMTVTSGGVATNVLFGPSGVTGATGRSYYLRFYIRFASNPAAATVVGVLSHQSGNNTAQARLNTDGTMNLIDNGGTVKGSASAVLATNTWHRIELRVRINASTSDDEIELVVNGVQIGQQLNANLATAIGANFPQGIIGVCNAVTATILYDDCALNDDTGTDQNTYPGDGKVVYLKPISDNAVGSGWTNDAAATTNLFASVDNNPPTGIADTTAGDGTHQVRNAGTNSNQALDVNCETYTTGGIPANANITLVMAVANTGAPVITGAKQGTLGVVSNPVQTPAALGALGTSGAFWSGTAAGTYATGWKHSYGPVSYNPTVTKGSSPVLRINQVTGASTRIAMVCNLGVLVEFTGPIVSAAGTITPAGAAALQTGKALSGALAPAGNLDVQVSRALGGALTPTGTLARAAQRPLAVGGTLAPAGTELRQSTRALTGAVAPSASVTMLSQHGLALTAALGLAGAVARATTHTHPPYTGLLALTGGASLQLARGVSGALSPVGGVARAVTFRQAAGGTLAPAGALARGAMYQESVGGALALQGGLALAQTVGIPPVIDTVRGGLRADVQVLRPTAAVTKQRGVRVG
jgi:hypothetical protein